MPAGARVAGPVNLEAGRHVLGDRVVQAADLLQGRYPHGIAGADEHRGAVAVARALDQCVEEELLGLGGLRDECVVVAVDLRADDEADVRVAEVAEHPLQVVGQRYVIGVDRGEEVVRTAVRVEPGVVVAVLGPRAVRALGPVPVRDSLAGEVVHPEAGTDLLHRGVVALVEQPDVQRSAVPDADRSFEGLRHHLQGLLARDEGGEEGDPGAGLGHDGDRVTRDQRRVRVRQDIHRAEELDQTDRDEHDDVEDQQRVVLDVRVASGPVLGLHQPGEQAERDERRGAEQERGADPVRLLREQRAEPHGVGLVRIGLGQWPGQPAVVLVVVTRQRLIRVAPLYPGPQLRG